MVPGAGHRALIGPEASLVGGLADAPKRGTEGVLWEAQVVRWCRERGIGLVLIGPEAPLVGGLAEEIRSCGET